MLTKSDLFWHVFQSSGHVGAYLLYTSYRGAYDDGISGAGHSADVKEMDESHPVSLQANPMERSTEKG